MNEALEQNKRECAEILERLLTASAFPFDASLESILPHQHGVYVISRQNGTVREYLHAGRSKDGAKGLLGRIWTQHRTSNMSGDLVQKIINRGLISGDTSRQLHENARVWINQNCFVQWVVVEEDNLRCWAEHYLLSILRPSWGR